MSVGWASLLLFTRRVFRPDVFWARCLVGLALAMMAVNSVLYIGEVSGESPRAPAEMPGFIVLISFPLAVGYFWTTFESLHYHRRLKRRLSLGLSEAVVVDRVLLWGLMTLAAGVAVVINMTALAAGAYLSPPVVLVSSVLGRAHAGCLFFAFHAPAWYTGWLERRALSGSRNAPA